MSHPMTETNEGAKVTKEQLAKLLNGREIGNEITKEEEALAKKNGLVVIYGASDDLAEIAGAISDEVSIYEGGLIPFADGDLLKRECEDDDCPHEDKRLEKAIKVKAKWCEGNNGWRYEAPFPVAKFSIKEDGDEYCEGIVFPLREVYD